MFQQAEKQTKDLLNVCNKKWMFS